MKSIKEEGAQGRAGGRSFLVLMPPEPGLISRKHVQTAPLFQATGPNYPTGTSANLALRHN